MVMLSYDKEDFEFALQGEKEKNKRFEKIKIKYIIRKRN